MSAVVCIVQAAFCLVKKERRFTILSCGGSEPASISSTEKFFVSASLAANVEPAVPAPTIIKSKLEPSEIFKSHR